jgi:hypothetical protein
MKFAGVTLRAPIVISSVCSIQQMNGLRAAERHDNLLSRVVSRDVSVRIGEQVEHLNV